MKIHDTIRIDCLEITTRIGITEEERSAPQQLTVSVVLYPQQPLTGTKDDLSNTVDYFTVCREVEAVANAQPRNLIEKLAEDIVYMLFDKFPLHAAEAEVHKYILSNTNYVSAKIYREKK